MQVKVDIPYPEIKVKEKILNLPKKYFGGMGDGLGKAQEEIISWFN